MNLKWLAIQYMYHTHAALMDIIPDPLMKRNARFHNLHNRQRCFILGSGPSIKEQDLTKLKNEIVMTQNHFHAHEQISIINPSYHVIVPKYQPKEYDSDWDLWFKSMYERLPKKTILFFGKNSRYLVEELHLFKERAYYIKHGYSTSVVRRAPVDITKTIMAVPTALNQCLAIAIYMGFSEIFLLGFDLNQNYLVRSRSEVRFYESSPITINKAELAFEDAAEASGYDWFHMWVIWRQCNLLEKEAERKGIKIINATKGGLLNMFERRKYEDIL